MQTSKHFGLIGGLGVGATTIYYQAITDACAKLSIVTFICNKAFCIWCKLHSQTQVGKAFDDSLHYNINDLKNVFFG